MIRSITKLYCVVISVTIIILIYYLLYIKEDVSEGNLLKEIIYPTKKVYPVIDQNLKYLIKTSQCKIAEINPYSKEIVDLIKEKKYTNCSQYHLLTFIKKNKDFVTLNVNRSLLRDYSIFPIKCCYSNITRVNYEKSADNEIGYTPCLSFKDSVEIKFPYIKVKCSTLFGLVYVNVHATTFALDRKVRISSTRPKYSVLLIGIDSMSKSNLRRTMTKTYEYVEKNMINLKGYNKVGENTFPNIMAFLTGHSMNQLNKFCNYSTKINKCKLIWDNFRESDYVTAYAEDDCRIVTYNYDRPGFLDEPTDFYYHPYILAAENISIRWRDAMTYCAGPETSGERIMNAAKDFAVTFQNVPHFGFFWTNSFSHDNINLPAVMDHSMFNLLSDPEFVSSLNNTILIFLSDHGFRFGNIRYTHTGWLEERLPFIYIRVPQTFKLAFPEKYNNLLINSHRLTVPYDLFNTFQDILQIGNDSYRPTKSKGCAGCQSLFLEINENRTCKDASIGQHWCTCKGYNYVNTDHPNLKLISEFIVSKINFIITFFNASTMCSKYTIKKIRSAGVSEPYLNDNHESAEYFLIMVETYPTAIFEATVEAVFSTNRFKLLGEIIRMDRYGLVSTCLRNSGILKKYCYCLNKINKF